jgi:hypothetical protein
VTSRLGTGKSLTFFYSVYDLARNFPFSLTCFILNLFAEVREEESLNLTAAIWFAWGVLLNSGIGNNTPKVKTRWRGKVVFGGVCLGSNKMFVEFCDHVLESITFF